MKRFKTRVVQVGSVAVGGDNPIRLQSMTTSPTRDIAATIEQIKRLVDVGCEIARVTVQGKAEAEACEAIKNALVRAGLTIPLVADIHFYPPAALLVADFADKIRINPGNFADRRASFQILEYTDTSYAAELERIEEVFTPLVEKCKRLGRSMRIGVNHGSLSDRIMNRFGDSPPGMVESAFEYARVCRKMGYHDIIFSMKSSNPVVMIAAYRLLVEKMLEVGWDYPLHLGVTEAGEGQEGRVKSSIGIGGLLLDGIGDTIRVSLTEDPWEEIDPAKRLVRFAEEAGSFALSKPRPRHRFENHPVLHPDGSVLKREEVTGGVTVLQFAEDRVKRARAFCQAAKEDTPILFDFPYDCSPEDLVIRASAEYGALLCDGYGQGICMENRDLGLAILQGARMRATKTEFISCPGCGRTLFQLQEVTRQIREKTGHLPGVKIAVMGCIVNGPGEMADADFGYVGSKTGKIDLYIGKKCVEKNIDSALAVDRLVALIKEQGRWIEPVIQSTV